MRFRVTSLGLLFMLPVLVLLLGASGCETLNVNQEDSNSDSYQKNLDNQDRDYRDNDRDKDYRDNDRNWEKSHPMRQYDYYPRREVYYNRTTGEYTYWNNGKLERRRELPDYIKESMGRERTSIRLPGDEPERYHDRIKRDYPTDSRGSDRNHDHDGHDRNDRNDRDHTDRRNDIPRDAHVYGQRSQAEPYDYYPARQVFFNPKSREYIWKNNGKWNRDKEVPDYIRKSMGQRRVRVYISGNQPEDYAARINDDIPK
jgi:hypothetical protein